MEETRILVVEDEAITAMDIKNRLEQMKYNVVGTAFSGIDAITKAKELKPNLILMDVVLKGPMDGTEAAQIISRELHVPIIYLTAYSDSDTFNRAKLCIPYGYITKPFEARDLRVAIEMAVYRREMENKLALAEKRNQVLMENASCGFFVHNLDGIVFDINKVGESIFGAEKTNIINRDFRRFVIPQEQEYASVQLSKLAVEKRIGPNVGHILQPSGDVREVEFSSVCVNLNDDNIILSIVNDITERTKIHNQTFLADKLASVGILAVGIIHEINNPLNCIKSNLEFIKDKINKLPINDITNQKIIYEINEIVNESIDGSNQINKIIRYLKGFARSDDKNLVPIDIHREITLAIKIAKPQLVDHVKVETDFDKNIPLLITENNKLQQVFLNLIINAVQAFQTNNQQTNIIQIKTALVKNKIQILVRDNGVGIAEKNIKKIFDPFYTTKPVGTGTGLGLSICYDIIHAMGGVISVKSKISIGTTFTISLPLNIKAKSIATNEIISTPTSRLKILIVDDMSILLKSLKRLLRDDHDITDALGGRKALTILEEKGEQFDLIISDINMQDVNGIDLYNYIAKKYPKLQDRIIFISGGSLLTGSEEFFSTIKNPRLNKPFTREELFQTIAKFYE